MERLEPKRKSRRRYSFLDIHKAVFDRPPARRSVEDMDEGIRLHMLRTSGRRSRRSARVPPASAES